MEAELFSVQEKMERMERELQQSSVELHVETADSYTLHQQLGVVNGQNTHLRRQVQGDQKYSQLGILNVSLDTACFRLSNTVLQVQILQGNL